MATEEDDLREKFLEVSGSIKNKLQWEDTDTETRPAVVHISSNINVTSALFFRLPRCLARKSPIKFHCDYII